MQGTPSTGGSQTAEAGQFFTALQIEHGHQRLESGRVQGLVQGLAGRLGRRQGLQRDGLAQGGRIEREWFVIREGLMEPRERLMKSVRLRLLCQEKLRGWIHLPEAVGALGQLEFHEFELRFTRDAGGIEADEGDGSATRVGLLLDDAAQDVRRNEQTPRKLDGLRVSDGGFGGLESLVPVLWQHSLQAA